MHKLISEETDDGADQNCLAVVTAAEQNHNDGNVSPGLDDVAYY